MDVTERSLNTKVVVFLEILWFIVEFLPYDDLKCLIRLKKCRTIYVVLVLALILTPQSYLNYTLYDIIAVAK